MVDSQTDAVKSNTRFAQFSVVSAVPLRERYNSRTCGGGGLILMGGSGQILSCNVVIRVMVSTRQGLHK